MTRSREQTKSPSEPDNEPTTVDSAAEPVAEHDGAQATLRIARKRRRRSADVAHQAPDIILQAVPIVDSHEPTQDAFAPLVLPKGIEITQADTSTDGDSPPSMPIADPNRWDRYEIRGLLGRGGMGAVYEARDKRIDRIVAIKFLHSADPYMTKRLLQEARAQARVEHPNVCKVLEVGEVEGRIYIAMELIAGESLANVGKSMSIDDKVSVLKTITEAVAVAHRLDIVHRDIKPANIMIEAKTGRPVLMDFGLARETTETRGLTESGAIMGTPNYMPPEQARGNMRSVDARGDIYSLGATLYDLLAGEPPFAGENPLNVILDVLIREPIALRVKNPDIPAALDIIVSKCLNKEPHQRYTTAEELADDLDRFLQRKQVVARRLGLLTRLYWRAKRNKPMAIAIVALAVTMLAFIGYGIRTAIVDARNEAIARKRAELGQKLGQAVKELEWLVRSAYLIPLHDTGPEKNVVRARMSDIEAEMQQFGDLGAGLDHYALGRGYLALQEWAHAKTHLLQAEKSGVHEPDLHYAIGRALGELYWQALAEARQSGDKSYFEKRKKEIELEYLSPAISHLERCRGLPSIPAEYLEGLIHFYRGRHDDALREASLAQKSTPWLYEAYKLAGDVHLTRALDGKDRGDNDQAEREFALAVVQYERAADIGRSDATVYEALAEAWIRQEELELYRGNNPHADAEKALAAADKAIVASPKETSGYTKQSYASYFEAQYAQNHGASPEEIEKLFQAQITSGKRAVELHPNDAHAHLITGIAHARLAELAVSSGKDASNLLNTAYHHFDEAIRIRPGFPWAYNDYGWALGWSGASLRQRNGDAKQTFLRAIEMTRKSFEIDDRYAIGYNNTSVWLTELGQWQRDHSEDPEKTFLEAIDMANAAIRINPQNPLALTNAGLAYSSLAAHKWDIEQDGQKHAQLAIDQFTAALNIDPKFVFVQYELARAYQWLAVHQHDHGTDPTPALEKGLGLIDQCFQIDTSNAECASVQAKIVERKAQWAKSDDPSAADFAEKAQSLARRAADKLPERPDLWLDLAETCLVQSEILGAKNLDVLQEGFSAIDRALKLAPGWGRALAIRGSLQLQQASIDSKHERDALSGAAKSFSRAFEANRLLERRYGKAAEEVKRRLQKL